MVIVQPRWLLPKLNSRTLKKMPRVKLKPTPHKKMPKLTWRLKELRCEGVEFNAFGHMLCKDILAHLRHHTFREMKRVFSYEYPL
jgi:hypothetical protein